MSITHILGAAALLAMLGTSPARAAEPLQPTAKWNVDFGDAHCTAMRAYGSAEKPITLVLKPAPIGDVMQLSVVRAGDSVVVAQHDGTLIVDRSTPLRVSVLGYGLKDTKLRVSSINLPSASYEPIRTAKMLQVRTSGVAATFALSHMGPVTTALDRCVADLRKVWHLGEHSAVVKTEATRGKPLVSLFSSDDYPQDAVRAEVSGTAGLILLIDETGKVASCMVTQASGRASLDSQSCAIIATRGRFSPALDAEGKPVKSGTASRIKWQMP